MGVKDLRRLRQIVGMYRQGQTHREIGEHFGISKQRVQKLLSTYTGITAQEGGRSLVSQLERERIQAELADALDRQQQIQHKS